MTFGWQISSERLLNDGRTEKITWTEFSRRYRKELKEGCGIDRRNKNIKNHGQKFTLRLLQNLGRKGKTITLLCHCDEDQPRCHRHLLQKVLKGKYDLGTGSACRAVADRTTKLAEGTMPGRPVSSAAGQTDHLLSRFAQPGRCIANA
jgi:uncharacterized protein YeaO (DUF488 family)